MVKINIHMEPLEVMEATEALVATEVLVAMEAYGTGQYGGMYPGTAYGNLGGQYGYNSSKAASSETWDRYNI